MTTTKTEPLYDLFYEAPEGSIFVMRSPLKTIGVYLRSHPSALQRIENETRDGGVCKLHQNDARKTVHVAQRAGLPLGTER